MAQLDDTSTPTPFILVGKWKSRDVVKDEKTLHQKLKKYRVRSNREFFELHAKEATPKINSILGRKTRHLNVKKNIRTKNREYNNNGLAQGFTVIFIMALGIFFLVQ